VQTILLATEEGILHRWQLSSELRSAKANPLTDARFDEITQLQVDRRTGNVAVVDSIHGVSVWQGSRRNDFAAVFPGLPHERTKSCQLAPDGRQLATISYLSDQLLFGAPISDSGGTLLLWDLSTTRIVKRPHVPDARIQCMAFLPDGESLVTGLSNGHIIVWDRQTARSRPWGNFVICEPPFEEFVDGKGLVPMGPIVSSVAVSPDGRWLAAGSGPNGSDVRIWPIPQGKRADIKPPPPHMAIQDHFTVDLEFSADSATLLIVTDRAVELWDVASGSRRLSFGGTAAQFSPDGHRFALRRPDEFMMLDANTGMTVFAKRTLEYDIAAFAFSGTGDLLIADKGGRLHAWRGATGDEISLAEAFNNEPVRTDSGDRTK